MSQGRHDHRAARAGTGGRRRTPALGPRERLGRLLPAAAVALLLAGCGGAGSAGQEVRAAEQVFVEDPVVEPDLSGTSATLRVVTDREMACAVVFGRDESLGDGIATDDDMGGGAHTDHAAVMRNLEPDTEYFYRVQGSGADGKLYRSELRTFRTPPATAVATPGDNVALGARVVDVSSEFSDAYAAANAVDGNPNTEWSSAGDGDDASITLDLGRQVGVVGVALRSRSMSDGTSVIETFTVTVDDGQTLGPFDAGTTVTVHEVDVTGRVLRIDAERTTGGNTGAAEIEVYGAP
ncbi:MAG: discoidin domain-containing protein [Actinomycetota bacterium]|nr:discoidin domain-containing protein [Actinomycetota bacterium]